METDYRWGIVPEQHDSPAALGRLRWYRGASPPLGFRNMEVRRSRPHLDDMQVHDAHCFLPRASRQAASQAARRCVMASSCIPDDSKAASGLERCHLRLMHIKQSCFNQSSHHTGPTPSCVTQISLAQVLLYHLSELEVLAGGRRERLLSA
ncbi:hypothetical protein LZ30DRAFT_71854 [Colletotrichum cereale]|nr:hypothetical protein LZ30DRAFT_71854 [Colletotrichum cereale]